MAPRAASQSLDIRPIAAGEDEAVIGLWHAAGLTRPWNDPQRDLDFARGKSNSTVLVGHLDGRVVASAMVGHDGHRGAVYYLAVQPEYQGFGLGRAMMGAVEAWLLNKGVWKLNLSVRAGNEDVLGFYDSLGYQRSATVLLERWIDPAKRGGS
ncbi:MAG: GNAT family acetyltransferase [Hyphomicrobiaceae bacterium]